MPFIYRNLAVSPHTGEDELLSLVASLVKLPAAELSDFRIIRKAVDARRKPRVKLIYSVSFAADGKEALVTRMGGSPGWNGRRSNRRSPSRRFAPGSGLSSPAAGRPDCSAHCAWLSTA